MSCLYGEDPIWPRHIPAATEPGYYKQPLIFLCYVPLYKSGCVCTAFNLVNVGAPGRITGDVNPQIPSSGHSFQDLTMKSLGDIDRLPGTRHLHHRFVYLKESSYPLIISGLQTCLNSTKFGGNSFRFQTANLWNIFVAGRNQTYRL